MKNPFTDYAPSPQGPAHDILPVTPDDDNDLPILALSIFVEVGGVLQIVTRRGQEREIVVQDQTLLPVMVRRVMARNTTASGIHALVIG